MALPEDTIALQDTVILLLEYAVFALNQKKSAMTAVQETKFLEMVISNYFPSLGKISIKYDQKRLVLIDDRKNG